MPKKFTLTEANWGPNYLVRRDNNRQCCLGMATLQCGVPPHALEDVAMPTSWELDIYAMDDEHAEFKQFVKKGRTSATQKLLDMAARFHALDTDSPVDNNHSIFSLMAYVNDYYHEVSRKGPAITKEETVAIIRAGFEEMGYEFEFIPMEQAA